MPGFPWRLVTIDIDGTLTTTHGWRWIARQLGREGEYRRAEGRISAGITDEDAHLRALFNLARGIDAGGLERALETTPRVAGIREAVTALHRRGCRVGLLTHNPRYVIDWYCRRYGFDGGSGGWGSRFRGGHVVTLPKIRADKLRGLRELEAKFEVDRGRICHVGDAWPDARLAPMIGGFVAFNAGWKAVRREADAVVDTDDLRDLLPVLDRLRPRSGVKSARRLPEVSSMGPGDAPFVPDGVRRTGRSAPSMAEPPSAQRGRRTPSVPPG